MFLGTAVLSLSVVVFTAVSGSDSTRTIYVDPVRGNNTEKCVEEPSYNTPCKSLGFAFQTQYRSSSTTYSLQPGTHYLDSTASDDPFTGLTDIAITGNASSPSSVRILCFKNNSGLSFISVQSITLGNFTLTNCSSRQSGTSRNISDSTQFELLFVTTALYYSHCTSITMEGVVISNSPNASGLTVYNTIGTNTFTRCEFANNSGPDNSSFSGGGGGGVYIEFSYCVPGDTSCQNGTQPSYTNSNHNSVYIVTDCSFTNNSATTKPDNMIPNRENHTSFGLGGGMSLFFCGNSTRNRFLLNNCSFSANSAKYGGGLFIEFDDTSANNSVTVTNSSLLNNSCERGGGRGGGVYTSHSIFRGDQLMMENRVKFTNCNVVGNKAMKGGGLRIVATPQNKTPFNVIVSGVTFRANRALDGGAAMMVQLTDNSPGEQSISLFIQNCSFRDNSVHTYEYQEPTEVGLGIVYIEAVNAIFDGTNTFEGSFGSPLALVEASAKVTNTRMIFTNNQAVNGGGLTLLGSAKIIINHNTFMLFDSNKAYSMGGAIFNKYTEMNTYGFITNCFVEHEQNSLDPDEWGAHIIFSNNHDLRGRNAIYSTSVLSCGNSQTQNLSSVFCWKNWSYQYDGRECQHCSQYIRTAPGNIEVNTSTSDVVSAYPGEVKDIPISVFDDLNHTTKAIFSTLWTGNMSSLDPNYAYMSTDKIRVLGNPSSSLQIDLNSIGDRQWHVRFFVNLTECPPGLMLLPAVVEVSNNSSEDGEEWEGVSEEEARNVSNGSTSACLCDALNGTVQTIRCNTDTDATLLSGYWMGKHRIGRWTGYVVSSCPSGYCRTGKYTYNPLPKDPGSLDKHICGFYKRTGRVCGECLDGYGPVVFSGSFECVFCNISSHQITLHATYYVFSVYVPLFLLFLAIIIFNIKLTTGPANAFILFGQVISSTFNINANKRIPLDSISPNIDMYLKAYKFPYGIFNLQFFELFVPETNGCFGNHLNVLDLLLLEYLVAFSPLLMIVAIVGVYRIAGRCNWCSTSLCSRVSCDCKCPSGLRKSTVPAIASFILLSYTKFSLTSSLMVTPTHLTTLSGKRGTPMYFYYAGNEAFSDPGNILHYILPATLVFVTFVAIPPLLLLDYPLRWLERVLRLSPLLWRLYPSGKIHILLDAFQGCYKDRYRWFAGLYFIFRLLINVTNALTEDLKQLFMQGFFCSVFALLVFICKPYRNQFYLLNYFDGFIFVNLAIINQITLYLYADTRRGANPSVLLFSVQYILVFLPLVYMLVYIMWRLLPIPRTRTKVREWLETRRYTHQMENLIQNRTNASSDSPDDVNWERARAINRYKPVKSPGTLFNFPISQPSSDPHPSSSTSTSPSSSEKGRGSRKDYGSTGRSDSGIASSEQDNF